MILGDILRLMFWRYLKTVVALQPMPIINAQISVASFCQFIFGFRKFRVMREELVKSRLTGQSLPFRLIYETIKIQNSRLIKMCMLHRINRDTVQKYLRVDGLYHLEGALQKGKGAIMLNPHFGPYLFALPAIGWRGYSVFQVALQGEPRVLKAKGFRSRLYDAKFQSIERKMPVEFINATSNPMVMRTILKKLEENAVIFFASTGRGGKAWHEVDFLGRRSLFSLTPFKLAKKTGAVLLPVFALYAYPIARIIIGSPMEDVDHKSPEKMLDQYVSMLSEYVHRYPHHFAYYLYEMNIKSWFDDHPFFKDYRDAKTG